MVKIYECLHASSMSTDLHGLIGRRLFPSVNSKSVKLQVSNVLARNCKTTGVQGAPKSFIGSIMRNVETQTFALRAG